jgi:hypothetical protein
MIYYKYSFWRPTTLRVEFFALKVTTLHAAGCDLPVAGGDFHAAGDDLSRCGCDLRAADPHPGRPGEELTAEIDTEGKQ